MCSLSMTPSIPASSASWAIRTRARRSRGEMSVQFSLSTRTRRGGSATVEANRQTPEAVGEVGTLSAGLARELHGADALHQLLQVDPELQAREVHAKTVVRAAATERQRVTRVAGHVEPVRIGIVLGVAVGGGKPDRDAVPGRDVDAAQLRVDGGRPPEEPHRRGIAEHL